MSISSTRRLLLFAALGLNLVATNGYGQTVDYDALIQSIEKGERYTIPFKGRGELIASLTLPEGSIHYQMQIMELIKKTKKENPSGIFDIVSLIPATGSTEKDRSSTFQAYKNAQKVHEAFVNAGVPAGAFEIKYSSSTSISVNTLMIYHQ